MKRLALTFGALMLTAPWIGCGGSPPPGDRSNMPPEVRAEEEKLDAANAKRTAELQKRLGK